MDSSFVLLASIYTISAGPTGSYKTVGNKVMFDDGSGSLQHVAFNGIGLTCTEYMMKPGMDDKNAYPGYWAFTSCFGGPSSSGGPIQLNKEPQNVADYLLNNYVQKPSTTKVVYETPFDQIAGYNVTDIPMHRPIVRMPMTGSCYLYDEDVDTGNHLDYVNTIDALVQFFTDKDIAVVLDLHWNCPDSTKLGCTPDQEAKMALASFGGKPGANAFWDAISAKYANNSYVFYELFNEPYQNQYDDWYTGGSQYAGMKTMYQTVRKNDPQGMVIMGGAQQYALDSQSLIAFYLQYNEEEGSYPTNIIFNEHPYQGGGQALEHSLQSIMRLSISLQTIAPVIFTEFGQYCCTNDSNAQRCTGGAGPCSDHQTGDNFVFNIVNYALQMDISWIGWGWRGTNDDYPCSNIPDCDQPDMRSPNGTLVTGKYGGAAWQTIWDTYVNNQSPKVGDATNGQNLDNKAYEPKGYLPRPCILGTFNLGDICGWDDKIETTSLKSTDFSAQSIYQSYLPGLPPDGSCTKQGCGSHQCGTYMGPCTGR